MGCTGMAAILDEGSAGDQKPPLGCRRKTHKTFYSLGCTLLPTPVKSCPIIFDKQMNASCRCVNNGWVQ